MIKKHPYLRAVAFAGLLTIGTISALAQGPGAPGAGGPRRAPNLPPIPLAEDTTHTLTKSFTPATSVKKAPDTDGFIQRWLVLEPVKKNDRTNSQLTEGYLRETFASNNNFSSDYNSIPKNGDKVKIGNQ